MGSGVHAYCAADIRHSLKCVQIQGDSDSVLSDSADGTISGWDSSSLGGLLYRAKERLEENSTRNASHGAEK